MSLRSRSRSRRGSVLIVVLWASLGLVSITLLFGGSMLMTYRGTDNALAGRQADLAIDGAARYVEMLVKNAETPGVFPAPSTYQSIAMPLGEARFWFIGRPDNGTTGVQLTFGLVDEASKLNINVATPAMLMQLPGMTEDLAAAIVDWRDEDDEITENGAESETYLRMKPAYSAKNAPFETLDELALVNGATRLILYGEDQNLNGVLDENENDGDKSLPPDNSDGKLDPGVLEYLTVFSRESNKQSDGTAKVNISEPGGEQALLTLLTDKLGAQRAGAIMANAGPPPPTSVLEFAVRTQMTEDEFAQVGSSLTTTADPYRVGLVNVNTASEAVLACIPGIGTEKASSLVASRLNRTQTDAGILWVAEILGQEGVSQAGPFLTGQTFQISADVAAVGRHGRGYRRARIVIDSSTGTPRIIYRRDLGGLGWALGPEVRTNLATLKGAR